jgi:anaerobic magnesium-protoporphyrin IX monomethyl ester cyclase
MTTDVLFGQAYFLRFDPKLWAAQQPYPPLGTLYAAACAREHGYEVRVFDAMLAASEVEWAEALDRHRPRVAILYEDSFNYLSKMCLLRMRQAAVVMIDAARARGVPIIVAGSDASDHPALYLNRGAQVVVTGEGEVTVVEALDALTGRRDGPLSKVAGICLLDAEGRTMRTAPREFVRDLDRLPRPAWDLVDIGRYRAIWRRRHGYFSMNIATTRGCPYHCNWCAKPIYGQRYAARSPEHVVDEIVWLDATYQPDHLSMADDIFGLKPGWIERFATIVEARGSRVPYKCLLRADGVTDAVARALAASGCRTAWIGAESGSQRILDAMEKGIRVDQIAEATRLLRGAGIEVAFFLQFGYPGETLVDIQRTLQMVQTCEPDDIGVSVSYPLPGTTFYERVKAQLGLKQNWVDSEDLAMMYRSTYPAEFYPALHRLVHAEFRAQRAGRLLRSLARRRASGRFGLVRELAISVSHVVRLPWIRRRVDRLAGRAISDAPPALLPVLSRQAASAPTEQRR